MTGEREGALSSLASKAWSVRAGGRTGVVERGDQGQVRQAVVVVVDSRVSSLVGVAKHQGPMGGSRPLIEEGRPMWCEGNCDVV